MNRSRVKTFVAGVVAISFAISLSLLVAEICVRLIADPVDYIEPYLVKDPILGHKIEPNSAGHDSWGFRNKALPASAKIVSIGDSQTYGVSATAREFVARST